jgi:hypothetical protein
VGEAVLITANRDGVTVKCEQCAKETLKTSVLSVNDYNFLTFFIDNGV